MSKYRVITIAIAVKNNRIARFGEEVDDSELTVNGTSLIEAGSLELIELETVKATKAIEVETETKTLSKKDEVKATLSKK